MVIPSRAAGPRVARGPSARIGPADHGVEEPVNEGDAKSYREMVSAQSDEQIDRWAADLFIDFAKRMGVGTAIAAFCRAGGLDAKGFQRAFLVGGGPDRVVGIDTAGAVAAPIFELPKAIAGLRRIDPEARQKLIEFLVEHREVMSYTP
jgi:hypothetical protein